MTEETDNKPFNVYEFDYTKVQTGPEYTVAEGNQKVELKVESVEVEENEEYGTIRATIRQSFTTPGSVKKVGTGLLGNIFDRTTLNTQRGAKKFRDFVESHGGDMTLVQKALLNGNGQNAVTVFAEILQQFIGTTGIASISHDTTYPRKNDQTGEWEAVPLQKPRNGVRFYVVSRQGKKAA